MPRDVALNPFPYVHADVNLASSAEGVAAPWVGGSTGLNAYFKVTVIAVVLAFFLTAVRIGAQQTLCS